MGKAKGLTRTTACREEKLSEPTRPTILEFRFKAVHTKRGKRRVARMDTNGSVRALKGAIISSSTVHIPRSRKISNVLASIFVFGEETSILRLWLVLRSVGALVQDWCIGWPPGRGHADCRLLLIANVIRATVGVRSCDCSRILYACQRAETYSRCLNIPNNTYSRSCSIEMVVDSSRVPQYPFLLYVRIAKRRRLHGVA